MTSEVRLAGMRHCASLEAVRAWVSSNATCHRATIRSERAANAARADRSAVITSSNAPILSTRKRLVRSRPGHGALALA